MIGRGRDDIPEIPARRVGIVGLAQRPDSLAIVSGAAGYAAARVSGALSSDIRARGWAAEPIDDFPHFERDMERFFGHPIWRRPGMELSAREISVLVPVARMLSATERWTTGIFTSTGLTGEDGLRARESNLGHIVGMLDIVEAHYDALFALLGDTESMRELLRVIVGHDLPEFPKGDHSRSEGAGLDTAGLMAAAWQKQREETEAVDMIVGRTRRASYAAMVGSPMERYARGKPKRYTLETAHRGDMVSFLAKFIDLSQGTEHGCERIFPHYARTAQKRLHLHLEEGVEELGVIGAKTMRLVAHRSPADVELAADTLSGIAEASIARSREMIGGDSPVSGFRDALMDASVYEPDDEDIGPR